MRSIQSPPETKEGFGAISCLVVKTILGLSLYGPI